MPPSLAQKYGWPGTAHKSESRRVTCFLGFVAGMFDGASGFGAKLPIRDVRASVAVGGKADLETHIQTPGPPTADGFNLFGRIERLAVNLSQFPRVDSYAFARQALNDRRQHCASFRPPGSSA